MHRLTLRSLTLVVFETALIVGAVAVATYLRFGDWAWVILVEENGAVKTLLAAGVAQACLYYADLYDLRLAADRPELFVRIIQALGAASFILAVVYFWFPALIIGRGEGAGFPVNDPRVSRRHARIEWSGGQCVITDFSSNGTWVRFAGSPVPVTLRRESCTLYGEGEIGLGAAPEDFTAPTVSFRVINEL